MLLKLIVRYLYNYTRLKEKQKMKASSTVSNEDN